VRGFAWRRGKAVAGEASAVNNGVGLNILAQKMSVRTQTYSVKTVSLLLTRRASGSAVEEYDFVAQVRELDDDGNPSVVVASSSLPSSGVNGSGWVTFPFDIVSRDTPATRAIAVSFMQNGGDEDDYAAWGYSADDGGSEAVYSNDDGATWVVHGGVTRCMTVGGESGQFDSAYEDSESPHVGSTPGTDAVLLTDETHLSTGRFDGTKPSDDGKTVEIDHGKLLVSVVVDGSGSMGWNDRRRKKDIIVDQIISQIRLKWPGQAMFDVVSVGGVEIGEPSIGGTLPYTPIRIDPSNPSRTTPNLDGTTPLVTDQITACGFSNLESEHEYVIQSVVAGEVTLLDGSGLVNASLGITTPENMQSIGPSSAPILFSVSASGTGSEDGGQGRWATVATVPSIGTTRIRHPFSSGTDLAVSSLMEKGYAGDDIARVVDSSMFPAGSMVDIVDTIGASCAHIVTSVSSGAVYFRPALSREFSPGADGGILQRASSAPPTYIDGVSPIELLVMDRAVSSKATFYLQTTGGGSIEWDFYAMDEWKPRLATFTDMPLDITVSITDAQGESLGAYAMITLYVDSAPQMTDDSQDTFTVEIDPPLTLSAGDSIIALPSVEGIVVGASLVLMAQDGSEVQGYAVQEIDEDAKTIKISPSLYDDITLVGIRVMPPIKTGGGEQANVVVSAVDMTPKVAGRATYPPYRLPSDPDPVPVSGSDYNAHNQDEARWLHGSFSVPSVPQGDKSVAAIQILPITEDALTTTADKRKAMTQFSSANGSLSAEEQADLEAMRQTYEELMDDDPAVAPDDESSSMSAGSSEEDGIGEDYALTPPTIPVGGHANMTTTTATAEVLDEMGRDGFAFDMEDIYGSIHPQSKALVRQYTIFPVLKVRNEFGDLLAAIAIDSFPVWFMSPVHIFQRIEPKIAYDCPCVSDEGEDKTFHVVVPGVPAASGRSVPVECVVYDHYGYMQAGTARVRIFDMTRSREVVLGDPGSVVPNLKRGVCGDEGGKCDQVNDDPVDSMSYHRIEDSSYYVAAPENEFAEALYLDGYAEGGFDIQVSGGRCSFEIPPCNYVAQLMVMIEVKAAGNSRISCVRSVEVHISNPLSITTRFPRLAKGGYDEPTFPVSATVAYLGEPVVDNTTVSFSGSSHNRFLKGQSQQVDPDSSGGEYLRQVIAAGDDSGNAELQAAADEARSRLATSGSWPATPVVPEVSKTVDGVASGSMAGPHGPVIMHMTKMGYIVGDTEDFSVKVTYAVPNSDLVFSAEANPSVEWTGSQVDVSGDYPMYVSLFNYATGMPLGLTVPYADGWTKIVAIADVPLSNETGYPFFDDSQLSDDLVGVDRPYGGRRASWSTDSHVHVDPFPGQEMRFYPDRPVNPETRQAMGEPADGGIRGWAAAILWSAAVAVPAKSSDGEGCEWPCTELTLTTMAYVRFAGRFLGFFGCPGRDPPCMVPGLEEGSTRPASPQITWVEPLAFSFLFDGRRAGEDVDIVRDGVTPVRVDAEISFSGEAIPVVARRHNVRDAEGAPLGMPTVFFDCHRVVKSYKPDGSPLSSTVVRDESVSLTVGSAVASVSKTSTQNGHYHWCSVDADGNGATTGTVLENSLDPVPAESDHSHPVSSYAVAAAIYGTVLHSHVVVSVATTYLRPVSNQADDICVSATATYDASSTPVERTVSSSACAVATTPWRLEVDAPPLIYTSPDVVEGYSGGLMTARLWRTSGGNDEAAPEGTRVHFALSMSKPVKERSDEGGEEDKPVIISTTGDIQKPYGLMKATVTAAPEGQALTKSVDIPVYSSLRWFPNVQAMTDEPTDDAVYLDNAVTRASTVLGSSQVLDAVYMAAGRLRAWQVGNRDWRGCDAAIYVVSDWDLSQNARTVQQAVARALLLAGVRKAPCRSFATGLVHPVDMFVAEHVATQTGGFVAKVPLGYPDDDLPDAVADGFTAMQGAFNSGEYENVIDIGEPSYMSGAVVNVEVPNGAVLTIWVRFSSDGVNYTDWSTPTTLTETGSVYLEQGVWRYMQYRLRMVGTRTFESPRFSSVTTNYVRPGVTMVYFQPIVPDLRNDEFVNEVLVSHAAEIPALSSVTYGAGPHESADPWLFDSVQQPASPSGQRVVLLNRENEATTAVDGRTFAPMNGPWAPSAAVEVVKIEDGVSVVVDPSEYVSNPSGGVVTMRSPPKAGARVAVSILPDPVVRVVCRITNYSTDAAKIFRVGVMYNKTQRVRRAPDGTIIRQPIDMILEESSSESSGSSSSSGSSVG